MIVVGARCAGAPLAMLLARAGHRVAMVDRASFPSDTMSTHFIWPQGAARLASWGLLDSLRERGCEPITQITFDIGPVQLTGSPPPANGATDSYCPRRTVLDALLVESAVEAGADLIDRFVVSGLCWSDGRVAGLTGHRRGSPSAPTTLASTLVVGADGLHSTVAGLAGASSYHEHPSLTCVYYSYWSGLPDRTASFHARGRRLVLVWPTNDELTCVYVAWPAADFTAVRADVDAAFRTALADVPGLAEKIAAGRREHRFVGTRNLPNLYRTSAGPGWALAGDAGHHKDPATGMGISDAFLAADLLAAAIHQGITGQRRTDEALRDYQHRRDSLTCNGFELTLRTARLAPPSAQLEALCRRAADEPDLGRHVFGVLAGAIPIAELYADTLGTR